MSRRLDPLVWAGARLLLGVLVAGTAVLAMQDALLSQAMPLVRTVLDGVDGTFRTADLRVSRQEGEALVVRLATPAVTHVVGEHVVLAGSGNLLVASVSAGILLQPLVLAAGLLCAWPWRRRRELGLRALLAAPLIAAVTVLDVPMLLYGLVWIEEVNAFEPDRFSPLASWGDFMNAGGRFALTILAVAAAVAAARALTRPGAPGRPGAVVALAGNPVPATVPRP